MFKLESYITPLLMGYIDKYVKLRHEDFQLSLWGGDAVLNKLDLRLDAIEKAIHLPITFKSGFIHELRLHVPWTRLSSEPVVVTINTIECILKLRDGSESDAGSDSTASAPVVPAVRNKSKKAESAEEELPQGYLQSLVNRIVNNVTIVVNNLILKFVEDDIVLSLNVKSVESFSVDQDWERSFIELALPELVLRRVINVHDLTVCLDKRNASGKIDVYQDPLLYRCSMTCRMHMQYDSMKSKMPSATKFSVMCDKLDLSLTDTQVPMFFRLIELIVAIYYGTLDLGEKANVVKSENSATESQTEMILGDEEEGEGWGSWAWSYVPSISTITGYEYEDTAEEDRKRNGPSVLSIGLYCSRAAVVFKLTETIKDSSFFGPQKVTFRPCMRWEATGIGLDIVLAGLEFFNVQFGLSSTHVYSEGEAICGVRDVDNTGRDACFIRSGDPSLSVEKKSVHFLTASLFDPGGAENQGERAEPYLTQQAHLEHVTESNSGQRYGAFWFDYMYVMELPADEERAGSSHSSAVSESGIPENARENSQMRIVLYPGELTVCSSAVQRVHKFIHCMHCHDYEPYSKVVSEKVDESGLPPTEEQIAKMEAFTPIRTYKLSIIKPTIVIHANDLPTYDVKRRKTTHRSKKGSRTKTESQNIEALPHPPLPALVIQMSRFDTQTTSPMYMKYVIRNVSKIPSPSDNLLSFCHSQFHLEVGNMQAGLKRIDPGAHLSPSHHAPVRNVMHPWSGTFDRKTLLLPKYWKNPLQPQRYGTLYVSELQFNLSKPQVLLLAHVGLTWLDKLPPNKKLLSLSLMDDVFTRSKSKHPVLQMIASNLEVSVCETETVRAASGSLTTLYILMNHTVKVKKSRQDTITPLLCGPQETTNLYKRDYFLNPQTQDEEGLKNDCLTFTVQLPKQPETPTAPAAVFIDMQGVVGCVDPVVYDWLTYAPTQIAISDTTTDDKPAETKQKDRTLERIDSLLVVGDSSIADGTSPIKASHESATGSTVTLPTESHTASHSKVTSVKEEKTTSKDKEEYFGTILAKFYPLVKILQMQVEVANICVFLPTKHIELEKDSATMSIPHNLHSAFKSNSLPQTLVVCCPALTVYSSGMKKGGIAAHEIPIKSLQQSVTGEKLPWAVELSNASMYSLHQQVTLDLVEPVTIVTSVAVTSRYNPPASDNIAALGLVLHADMKTIEVSFSKKQAELIYDLLYSVYKVSTQVISSIQVFQELHTKSSAPRIAPVAPSKRTVTIGNSNSSQLEPADVVMTTTDTATDTTTEGQVTHGDSEDVTEGNVKLSLWLQWTLLRMGLKLYGQDSAGREIRLVSEVEDLTTSIDVQKVYSKVIFKIGNVSATHSFKRRDDSEWQIGSYDGILLSCNGHLSSSTQHRIEGGQKVWRRSTSSPPPTPGAPLLSPPPSDHEPAGHEPRGFLNLTLTRALRKHARRKLKRILAEGPGEIKTSADRGQVYLTEICLNMQPCDFVLNCPVFVAVVDMLKMNRQSDKTNTSEPEVKDKSPKGVKEIPADSIPAVSSANLPLVYINASNLRLFVPKCEPFIQRERPVEDYITAGSDGGSQSKQFVVVRKDVSADGNKGKQDFVVVNKSEGTETTETKKRSKDYAGDLFMLQVSAFALQPHADNPLPRIVIEKDVYRRAVHAGITANQGSEVEDRQYQLDIFGLSLSTGDWYDLTSSSRRNSQSQELDTQNPALEWNNLSLTKGDDEDVKLAPLASSFDLRIVAAPPVVYLPSDDDCKPALVCGQSLELNATSDMDFYLSVSQLRLLHNIYASNIAPLVESLVSTSLSDDKHKTDEQKHQDDVKANSKKDSKKSTKEEKEEKVEGLNFTPFDVLLTAGKISFMVYKHTQTDTRETKIKRSKSDLEWKEEDKGDLPEPIDPKKDVCTRIAPILYAYFSQPYSLVRCLPESQLLELSCYDIVFKGAKVGHVVSDESKFIPEPSDFTEHWIETRAGQADPKTGIPPSLYTMRITNFFQGPAQVALKIERPLRANFGAARIEQIEALIAEFNSMKGPSVPKKTDFKEIKPSTKDGAPAMLATLARISSINLSTVQLVLAVETCHDGETAGMQVSLSQIDNRMMLQPEPRTGIIEEVRNELMLHDFLIKTSYSGHWRPLLGPMTANINVTAQWTQHHREVPRLLVFVECGTVLLYCGQEHVLCTQVVTRQIQQWIEMYGTSSEGPPPKSTTSVKQRRLSQAEMAQDPSSDDLRAGEFVFVTGEGDHGGLPSAREVYFGLDYEHGRATLTWTYSEPRSITLIQATPVPFTLPNILDSTFLNENMKIPCVLQSWNSLRQEFTDYVEFGLSEHVTCEAELPAEQVASQTWRVLILHPRDKGDLCDLLYQLDGNVLEPVVSPLTLAASLKVDSCFLPHLVPSMQLSVSMATVMLHLANHMKHLGQKTPAYLHPFVLEEWSPRDQQVALIKLDEPSVGMISVKSTRSKVDLQMSGSVSMELVEYRNLTLHPLLSPLPLTADLYWQGATDAGSTAELTAEVAAGNVNLMVGQSAVHTLSCTADAWNRMGKDECEWPVVHYYVLCNNTSENMRVGQLATDEALSLHSRQALPYSWRSHTTRQAIRVCVESMGWQWSDPIDIDTESTSDYIIEKAEQRATVIVKVKKISNTQKQVIISGQMVFASRVSEAFDVKLLTRRTVKEPVAQLAAYSSLPSYVIEHGMVRAFKLRLHGQQRTVWSQEVVMEENQPAKLIKVQTLGDHTRFLHVWCHIFTQNLGHSSQHMVLLTPVFMVENQLPSSLLVNVSTPTQHSSQQLQLPGNATRHQLHTMPADVTHNITFQLGPKMRTSNPPITLSSGMIEQLPREAIDKVDIDSLSLKWTDQWSVWPYEEQESSNKVRSSLHGHTPETLVIHQPASKDTPNQSASDLENLVPDIDLQVTLTQCWKGCNTMLVRVAPYLLLVNKLDIDLVLILGDKQWPLPGSQTLAPPLIKGEFQLGFEVDGDLHTSPVLTLSDEDHTSRYLPNVEGLLYLKANMSVTVPIRQGSAISKVLYFTLHSAVQDNMRVLTVRERFSFSNMTDKDLTLDCHTVPLSNSKVAFKQQMMHTVPKDTQAEPLLFWNFSSPLPAEAHDPQSMHHIQYISVSQSQQVETLSTAEDPLEAEVFAPDILAPSPASVISRQQSEDNLTPQFVFPQSTSQSSFHMSVTSRSTSDSSLQIISPVASAIKDSTSKWNQFDWSHPLRVKAGDAGCRQNVSVPFWDEYDTWRTTDLTVATQIQDGLTYLVAEKEDQTSFVIQNRCHFGLHLGQTLLDDIAQEATVYEEAELTHHLPVLPPYCSSNYSFPTPNTRFPDVTPPTKLPRIHFAGCPAMTRSYVHSKLCRRLASGWRGKAADSIITSPSYSNFHEENPCHSGPLSWSHGIDLSSPYDVFVTVPGLSDIKVHMEKVGHTIYVFIEPMNRAEISAKEIRSRIKQDGGKFEDKLKEEASVTGEQNVRLELESAINDDPLLDETLLKELHRDLADPKKITATMMEVSLVSKQLSFVLLDEISDVRSISEMLRLTVDDVSVWYTPRENINRPVAIQPQSLHSLIISVADIQVDNQLYGKSSNYDFPVLLIRQGQGVEREDTDDISRLPYEDRVSLSKQKNLIVVMLETSTDLVTGKSSTLSLTSAIQPLSMYIEDTYIYDIVSKLETFIPSRPNEQFKQNLNVNGLPTSVKCGARILNNPLRLESVNIEPVNILLSVHASLKLFIASDNTPLSFGSFEKKNLFTSAQQITKSVVLHYASGALFRAGIVVGSLEILGNPTGLVRSVGSGVADLFRLPYEGLSQGPTAFIGGIGKGVGSLLKHISTGTLTSITNFASSVSRNMDRLSLDIDHYERQEASRRQPPQGLAQGLYNGLTGFGLSLLGAVAGLADQPLQSLTTDQPSTQKATGIVSGVGRGLVGAVTKPLGGAAELVCQTGMGLLQGAGLGKFPKHRQLPHTARRNDFPNSHFKYQEKLLATLPNADLLLSLSIQQAGSSEDTSAVATAILLLPDILFLVGDGDQQQQALAVSEIEVRPSSKDDRLLYVTLREPGSGGTYNSWQEDRMSHKDRVAAFVDTTTAVTMGGGGGRGGLSQVSPDSSPPATAGAASSSMQYSFHVQDSHTRDLFLAIFNMAKLKALGAGFQV